MAASSQDTTVPRVRVNSGTVTRLAAGQVQALCLARTGQQLPPRQVPILARALGDAVMACIGPGGETDDGQLRELIEAQLALLTASLESLPARLAEQRRQRTGTRTHGLLQADAEETLPADSLEDKLARSREETEQLLKTDCIQLGLLTPERAGQLSRNLTGKTPKAAAAEIITELRNNLHHQVMDAVRELDGGPWASRAQQADIRLQIEATQTIKHILVLTRQLLREREQWQRRHAPRGLQGLLRGKLRLSFRQR